MTDSTCQSNPASQPSESTEVHTDNNVTESSLHKVTDHKPSHSQVDRPLSVTTDNAENNHCVLDMTELPNNGNNNASAAATPVSANDSAILSDLSQVSEGKDNESESSLSSSTSLKRSDSGIHIETPHNADVENPQSAAASASAPAVAMVTDQSSPPSNEDMDAEKFDMQGNLCSSTPDDRGMRKLSSPTNDDQSASAMDDKESTGNNNMQAQATEEVACHVTSENPEKGDNDEIDAEKTDTDSHSLHEIGDSDLSDAELGGVETVEEVRRRDTRRKRHRRLMSSSSDSSDRDIENGVEGEAANQSDEEEEDMDVDYAIPKDPWQAYLELRKREYGLSNHIYAAHQFRTNTSGSTRLVQRLRMQYRMERHEGCVNALNFNKEGTLLASGSDDLKIVVWDWARNQEAFVFESGHRANVFQSKFLPYGGDCHIISCARDGQVRLAELSSTGVCKGTKKLAQHKGSAHKLALLNDTPHVFLSCGEDAVTFEIDVRQEKPNKLSVVKEGDKKIALYSIHANPSRSHEFCLGGRDHFVRIYDRRMLSEKDDAAPMLKYCPHHLLDSDVKANVTCAVYNYDGSEVLGTYNDEDIYLFDTSHSDGADSIKRFTGHRNNATVKGVNFYGPKSEFILSGSDCSNIFFWEKQSEKIVQYVHGDDGGVVNVLEPHPHAPILATSGLDHDVKIWAPTSEEATNLKGLCKVMKRNKKERDDDRMHEPDMIDGQMLWMLMHHLRRTQRRRARQEGEQMSSSSESSNTDSDSDDDAPEPMQCAPS